MAEPSLRSDCARCAALCCVAFAFDRRSGGFPIDKPNGVPCPQLDAAANRCSTYEDRASLGFHGCITYECNGAGQRVTQEVFGGRSWRDEPDILPDMTRAFVAMVRVHELLVLLGQAEAMALEASEQETLARMRAELSRDGDWSTGTLARFESSGTEQRVRAFLASLRHHFGLAG